MGLLGKLIHFEPIGLEEEDRRFIKQILLTAYWSVEQGFSGWHMIDQQIQYAASTIDNNLQLANLLLDIVQSVQGIEGEESA